MAYYYSDYEEVRNDFINKGIDVEHPGFHYSKEFMTAEAKEKYLLNNYARFVDTYPYSQSYLSRASREIRYIAELVFSEFSINARHGACVDLSSVLSRIFELEGYWNYIVKGALKIEFSKSLNIETEYFWPIDKGEFVAAHSWVNIPPFNVIDLSIKYQNFNTDVIKCLPDYIICDSFEDYKPVLRDIFSPEYIFLLKSRGVLESNMFNFYDKNLLRFVRTFRANKININNVSFYYIPTAITASDSGDLNSYNNITINGRTPATFYIDIVKPALNNFRTQVKE